LDSLAKKPSYLVELGECLREDMLQDYHLAVNSYLSVVRDMPRDDYETQQVNISGDWHTPDVVNSWDGYN